ncbi:MAG: PAS domain S-box protein [Desulfobacterium sp.]|nr:PAS domain S-box protein [Desulfobacterium sp.]
MRFLNRWPIRTTTPLLLFFSIFVIGTFSWIYSISFKNEEIEREARYELTGKMTSIQGRLNSYFRQNYIEGIQKEISATGFDRNVITAFFIDEQNRIIAATRLAMKGKRVTSSTLGAVEHENIFAYLEKLKDRMTGSVELTRDRQALIGYFPVSIGENKKELRPFRVGILCLHYDLRFLNASAHRTLTAHTMVYSVFLLFVSLFLWLYFHFTMTKRVTILIRTAGRFAAGDHLAQSGLTGQDEIAKVGEALDKMILERRQAEAALIKEQAFSKTVLENIEDGIAVCDGEGVLSFFNRAFREFHGLPEKPLPAEKWAEYYDLYLADGKTMMKKKDIPLFRALRGEHVHEVEMVIAPKKGEKRILLASGQSLADPYGKRLGAVVSMHDITARKQAEEELRHHREDLEALVMKRTEELSESEARYQNVFETIPDSFFIADSNGNILEANPAACQTYGYSLEEFKRLNALSLISPEFRSVYKEYLESLSTSGTFFGETIDIRKDRSCFHTEVSGTTIFFKGEKRLVAIVRDVSERKQAETALKESELLYKALFKKNRSVMLLIDPDTADIVDANPSACSYYGYSKKRITRMKISDINALSKGDVSSEMRKAESEQRHYFNFCHRLASGAIHDVEVYSGPVKVGGRSLLCSIVHDISKRKASENERERLIDKLQTALDEIKTLKGIVPICANCKKIRDDKGYWNLLESYIEKYSEASFSHGMCPECSDKLYGHENWYKK